MNSHTLAILDVETTGMHCTYDRIIEVGVLRVEKGAIVATYSSLVNPEQTIPPSIQRITGITQKDVQDAPLFRGIHKTLGNMLEGALFVAHNARFDYGFIKNEFARLSLPFSAKCLCTVRLSRSLFPQERHHNLDSVMERFGISCKSRHRAFDDANAVWEFLQRAQKRVSIHVFDKTVKGLLQRSSFPALLNESTFYALPESAGVYIFYGDQGSPLYVGKSTNIRSRVLAHFSSDHKRSKEMTLCQQIKHITYRQTCGELGALLLESHLIKRLSPLYNRQARARRSLVIIKESKNPQGYRTVSIDRLTQINPSDLAHIMGVFKSVKQAKEFLLAVSKEYQLCPRLLRLEKGKGACFSSQIEQCLGACIKKEQPSVYNKRFFKAYKTRRIKRWPFSGPVVLEEKNDALKQRHRFIIDQWCLIESSIISARKKTPFLDTSYCFDYDSYKIFAKYLLAASLSPR